MSRRDQMVPPISLVEADPLAPDDLGYRADFTRNEGVPGSNPGVGFPSQSGPVLGMRRLCASSSAASTSSSKRIAPTPGA